MCLVVATENARDHQAMTDELPPHFSLKCDHCSLCIREGKAWRRVGSVVVVVWSEAGPYARTLCGDCGKEVVRIVNAEEAAQEKKDE